MKPIVAFSFAMIFCSVGQRVHAHPAPVLEVDADILEDHLRGGMLAQVIGNLNGLPHEFKYIDSPGDVEHYTPSLPEGGYTDDDTDIEWVYLHEIVRTREIFLGAPQITAAWKRHINRGIFCSNLYARCLMNIGIEPPWTGNFALNPWADFNISGQFICESFGLMAPGMPQTAAKLGLNYTHVAIDGEPAQATQLFTTMIATACIVTDLNKILDAGLAAVDPKSQIAGVVKTVRELHEKNPDDWRATRLEIKTRWQTHGGGMRDRNGYELNTACVIAALLYGHEDFTETLRNAFNFGYDADCDAATAATIVGVMKGRRWMAEQGWNIKDVYRNSMRDDMPNDETLTSLENLVVEAARLTIQKNGGEIPLPVREGPGEGSPRTQKRIYRIPTEQPANIEPLSTPADQLARAKKEFVPVLAHDLATPGIARARAAYLAICLGEADKLKADSPDAWSAAITELEKHPAVVHNIFAAPEPGSQSLKQAALAAGLHKPATATGKP
ncbi:MAG TPA: ADP-ribosylglycohydrolase family protein [Lacipirellulaceae bacterium]|nr:ADP-ribosylglycohydrolase family protein [Lacipirellulaceae bacterium]